MKRVLALVVLSLLVFVPGSALAGDASTMSFPSCGSVTNRNTSHQFGNFNWVEYVVETSGVLDICGQWWVIAEASLVNVANSAASESGLMYAMARRQIMVPAYNRTYQTNGRHYTSGAVPFLFNGGWWETGNTVSFAKVVPPASSGDPQLACLDLDGVWRDTWCDLKASSPIIVDTARNGYALTSVAGGVWFDLDADGVPERVAWTARDSDDEFLAMDRNGNGVIDDGSELFGNHTPAYPMGEKATTANGFEALKFLESPSYGASRPDGIVDAADAPYSRLLLWHDANHNGISEPDELRPASEAGVVGISTDYKQKKRVDRYGNQFRQRGTIFWTDGRDFVYDVWLQSEK